MRPSLLLSTRGPLLYVLAGWAQWAEASHTAHLTVLPPGWCELFGDPNYNAQVEFEPLPDLDARFSGENDFASSGVCLRNVRPTLAGPFAALT